MSCEYPATSRQHGPTIAAGRDSTHKVQSPLSAEGADAHPYVMILILSADAVAAALLGALVETLGYPVCFASPRESAEQSIRRTRPHVVLVDAADSSLSNREVLGRATMRGVSVVMFGTAAALRRVRRLANGHRIETLAMPAEATELREILERATEKAG
jgi:DNA-binding NtrC family response regulator